MNQVIDVIRHNIRANSDVIRAIKDEALTSPFKHICPQHLRYSEYRGRKHEVTKWLIALHQAKGNHHRIKYHLYGKRSDGDPLEQPREAFRALQELQEWAKKGMLVTA